MIPDYIFGEGIEFFTDYENDYFLTKSGVVLFEDAPKSFHDMISLLIAEDPDALKGLLLLGISSALEQRRKFCRCRYPVFDLKADFTDDGTNIEYFNCPERKQCPAAGFLCKPLASLSNREIEVAMLLTEDLAEKQIADRLQISVNTVHTHLSKIRANIGASSKVGIVNFINNNIIF